jgi:hypothetical protein
MGLRDKVTYFIDKSKYMKRNDELLITINELFKLDIYEKDTNLNLSNKIKTDITTPQFYNNMGRVFLIQKCAPKISQTNCNQWNLFKINAGYEGEKHPKFICPENRLENFPMYENFEDSLEHEISVWNSKVGHFTIFHI